MTTETEGATNGSAKCDTNGDTGEGFSWQPCEFCGDHLGGDRFDAAITVREVAP